jgi:hypothetical protein
MQDGRHCKACGQLLAMHDTEGCTDTFPKSCKCGGAIKWERQEKHEMEYSNKYKIGGKNRYVTILRLKS